MGPLGYAIMRVPTEGILSYNEDKCSWWSMISQHTAGKCLLSWGHQQLIG